MITRDNVIYQTARRRRAVRWKRASAKPVYCSALMSFGPRPLWCACARTPVASRDPNTTRSACLSPARFNLVATTYSLRLNAFRFCVICTFFLLLSKLCCVRLLSLFSFYIVCECIPCIVLWTNIIPPYVSKPDYYLCINTQPIHQHHTGDPERTLFEDSELTIMSDGSDSEKSAASQARRRHTRERVSTAPSDICRVGVRVPPFWPEEPEIWFAQVEGQFAISGITSDATKFNYVIGHLDPQFSKEVKDIIVHPPAENKYEKLKFELIKRLTASKEKKVHQLLMHEELGDRKPSQFLRHLQSLAGTEVPTDFIRTIWSSRLPSNIQTLLASQPTTSLEALADLADRVQDIVTPTRQVAATAAPVASSSSMETMALEIAELKQAVKNLTLHLNRRDREARPRRRSRDNQRSRSTTRSSSSYRKFPLCWYHSKFGSNATKCVKPCDHAKPGNAQGSR